MSDMRDNTMTPYSTTKVIEWLATAQKTILFGPETAKYGRLVSLPKRPKRVPNGQA